MTPLEFAGNLARSDKMSDRVLGTAILVRGLTDDDGLRQGWPLDSSTVVIAARRLGLVPVSEVFIKAVLRKAPKVSDAMLNKGASQ